MTFLYIEPYPGNGVGLLGEIYAALQKHGEKNNYQVEVAGYGYPPIYIDLTSKPVSRADIEKLVKDTVQDVLKREKSNLKISPENAENVLFVENIHWLTHFDEQGKRDKNPYPPHEKKPNDDIPIIAEEFHVFLAHNAKDQPEVEKIGKKLKARGLKTWLDKEQILPGELFQVVIQQAIPKTKTVAVFIGKHGLGRWQTEELIAFLAEAVNRGIRVIPVLLPGVEGISEDYAFLRQRKWVKFPDIEDKDALEKLVRGITGEKPEGGTSSTTSPTGATGIPKGPNMRQDLIDAIKKMESVNADQLANKLGNISFFTEREIRQLCDKLTKSINYDKLPGSDQTARVDNLVYNHCKANNCLDELKGLAYLKKHGAFEDLLS